MVKTSEMSMELKQELAFTKEELAELEAAKKMPINKRASASFFALAFLLACSGQDGRFRMPSALLWAYLAEKIFLVLQLRKICGFSGVAFSPEGLWRGVASAAASLWLSRSGSRSIFTAREPSQALRASSPEGRAFWQCGKIDRHEVKLPPRGSWHGVSRD